jgi:peptide/nickel transport system permease protein
MQAQGSFLSHALALVIRNPISLAAFLMVAVLLILAAIGPSIVPYDPYQTDLSNTLAPPSADHWFGTDQVGRDVLSRVVTATRIDLMVAIAAVALSFALGVMIGTSSGYFGGPLDRWVSRITDMVQVFPLFVLAMALVAVLGSDMRNIVLATAIVNLPFYVRLARAEAIVLRTQMFVEAARVVGNSDLRILRKVLLPNALPNLMIQLSVNLGWAILNAASLSFIGLGIRPPTAEWGIMVAEGATQVMAGNWWLVVFPGLFLTLTVFSFNLLGDALRDLFDTRTR